MVTADIIQLISNAICLLLNIEEETVGIFSSSVGGSLEFLREAQGGSAGAADTAFACHSRSLPTHLDQIE